MEDLIKKARAALEVTITTSNACLAMSKRIVNGEKVSTNEIVCLSMDHQQASVNSQLLMFAAIEELARSQK